MVPNPAKKPAYQQVEKARRALHSAETTRDRELLAASTPPPGVTTVVTNEMINTINTDVHAAEATLDAALSEHQRSLPGCRSPRSTPASRSSTPGLLTWSPCPVGNSVF